MIDKTTQLLVLYCSKMKLCILDNVYPQNSLFFYSCCCCMPSQTYGKNGVTLTFRSFHRTAGCTTSGWSRCDILMCVLYIILSTTVSFSEDAILCLRGLLFFHVCVRFHFFTSTLCTCVMYLTLFDGSF